MKYFYYIFIIVSVLTILSCEIVSTRKLKVLNSVFTVFCRVSSQDDTANIPRNIVFITRSLSQETKIKIKLRLPLNKRDNDFPSVTGTSFLLWKNFHEENFPAKRLSSLFDNQPLKSQRTDFQTNFKRQQTIFYFNLHRNNDDNYSRSCLFLFTLVSRRTSSFLAISWFPGCL